MSACNMGGIANTEAMRGIQRYMRARGGEVWCLAETHLDKESQIYFEKMMEKEYMVFCQNRTGRKNGDKGSGAIEILVKRGTWWEREH